MIEHAKKLDETELKLIREFFTSIEPGVAVIERHEIRQVISRGAWAFTTHFIMVNHQTNEPIQRENAILRIGFEASDQRIKLDLGWKKERLSDGLA